MERSRMRIQRLPALKNRRDWMMGLGGLLAGFRLVLAVLLTAGSISAPAGRVLAEDLFGAGPGVNVANIIRYPTAFDQFTDHTFHTTIVIEDYSKPDLRLANLRYGFQLGNLQLLADSNHQTKPETDFENGVLRAKLRIATVDAIRTVFAIGVMGRYTANKPAFERISRRPYSLLMAITTEVIPFDEWGGLLVNGYLDNLVGVVAFRFQLYGFIHLVAEGEYFHYKELIQRDPSYTAGLELETEANVYTQLLYNDTTKQSAIQIGFGF